MVSLVIFEATIAFVYGNVHTYSIDEFDFLLIARVMPW